MDIRAGCLLAAVVSNVAGAQADTTRFFKKKDLSLTVVATAATVALAVYDARIARWARQPGIQGDSSRHDLVERATVINEVPLTLGALAIYGTGRLTGSRTTADVGLHLSESLVATEVITEAIRLAVGRARPHESIDAQYRFKPGRGLTRFEYRSFPSLHAAVSFATASTLAGEIRMRRPSAARYTTPLLYAAATIPGFTRIYLEQHWASDVLAGSVVGGLIGARMVAHAHTHRTRLDRMLLSARVAPSPYDGTQFGLSFRR